MTIDSVKKMKDALCEKLKVSFGSTVEEANDAQRRFATWNSTDFFGKIPLAAPGAQPVTSAG